MTSVFCKHASVLLLCYSTFKTQLDNLINFSKVPFNSVNSVLFCICPDRWPLGCRTKRQMSSTVSYTFSFKGYQIKTAAHKIKAALNNI